MSEETKRLLLTENISLPSCDATVKLAFVASITYVLLKRGLIENIVINIPRNCDMSVANYEVFIVKQQV